MNGDKSSSDVPLFDRIRLYDNTPTPTTTTTAADVGLDDLGISRHQHYEAATTHQNRKMHPPKCIARRDSPDGHLDLNCSAYERFLQKRQVNNAATCVSELYNSSENG